MAPGRSVGAYDDLRGTARPRASAGTLPRSDRARSPADDQDRRCWHKCGGRKLVLGLDGAGVRCGWPTSVMDTALIAGTANHQPVRPAARPAPPRSRSRCAGLVGSAPRRAGAAAGCLPSDLAAGRCWATAAPTRWARPWHRRRGPAAGRRRCGSLGVAGANLASERVSFTAVIDRTPVLRWLDQLGRG